MDNKKLKNPELNDDQLEQAGGSRERISNTIVRTMMMSQRPLCGRP